MALHKVSVRDRLKLYTSYNVPKNSNIKIEQHIRCKVNPQLSDDNITL